MSGTRQWRRTYKLSAGSPGSTGFLIGSESNGRALHISFSLEKSDEQANNTGTITVSNLNAEHRAILSQADCYVELQAGYDDNIGCIFAGWVSESEESRSGGDRDLKVEVIDGMLNTSLQGSISMSGVVSTYQVLNRLVSLMEFSSAIITDAAEVLLKSAYYDNGYAYVGKYRTAMQKVVQKAGCEYTIQNGVLQIYVQGEAVTSVAYRLSASTGLISIPKKITITETSSDDDSTDSTGIPGYQVEYFLNPAIGIGDLVVIDSSDITGYYRVHKLTIAGDNYSGDWKCTAQLIQVTEG